MFLVDWHMSNFVRRQKLPIHIWALKYVFKTIFSICIQIILYTWCVFAKTLQMFGFLGFLLHIYRFGYGVANRCSYFGSAF